MSLSRRIGWASLALGLAGFASGCGTPGAPQPPSLNLPDPVENLSATRTGNQVALSWTMPKRNTDKLPLTADVAVRVCRREESSPCQSAGNALKLSMTTDTNQYYLYYFDTNLCNLYRGHSGSANKTCLANHLTNTMYFQAQNYRGDNQTDLTHKGVIYVFMQFSQYQYPITKIGPGCLYDYYKMELRLTPHTPDGP